MCDQRKKKQFLKNKKKLLRCICKGTLNIRQTNWMYNVCKNVPFF